MVQLHERFTDDQVKVLLSGYCQGLLKRAEVHEMMGISKTRFFALLKEHQGDSLLTPVPTVLRSRATNTMSTSPVLGG